MHYTITCPTYIQGSDHDPKFWLDLESVNYLWEPWQFAVQENSNGLHQLIVYAQGRCLNLYLSIYHSWENKIRDLNSLIDQLPKNSVIISDTWDREINSDPRICYSNIMWNRCLAYYQQRPVRAGVHRWYYPGHGAYVIPELTTNIIKEKIFVSPGRRGDHYFRHRIHDYLGPWRDRGWIGDGQQNLLTPQLAITDDHSLNGRVYKEFPRPQLDQQLVGGYHPPHADYYRRSYISIYGESIEWGTSYVISEKTLDPLIKGHFILPWANQGFVEQIRKQGWLTPDFICYDYDNEPNTNRRFTFYCEEIRRLLSYSRDQWHQWYLENLDLLYENQMLFYRKGYHHIDFDQLFDQYSL